MRWGEGVRACVRVNVQACAREGFMQAGGRLLCGRELRGGGDRGAQGLPRLCGRGRLSTGSTQGTRCVLHACCCMVLPKSSSLVGELRLTQSSAQFSLVSLVTAAREEEKSFCVLHRGAVGWPSL